MQLEAVVPSQEVLLFWNFHDKMEEKLIKSQLGEPVCGQVAIVKCEVHTTLFLSACYCFLDYIGLNE
jgi:hypothetical protein